MNVNITGTWLKAIRESLPEEIIFKLQPKREGGKKPENG